MNRAILVLACVLFVGCSAIKPTSQTIQVSSPDHKINKSSNSSGMKDGKFEFPKVVKKIPLVCNLPTTRVYKVETVFTKPAQNIVNIEKNGTILKLGQYTLGVHQTGSAIIEATSVSLTHHSSSDLNINGKFNYLDISKNNQIHGRWTSRGNAGPILIADLETPSFVRLTISKVDPLPPNKSFEFIVYVDNSPVPLKIFNHSSIDVYGSKISVLLESWPPVGPFTIDGIYQISYGEAKKTN